jgi:hypothetical protein
MQRKIVIAIMVILTVLFTLYEWYFFIGAGTYCTGTSSSQYWETLACMVRDPFAGLLLIALLNTLLAIGLTAVWSSTSLHRLIRYFLTALCVVYVVIGLFFSLEFWMFEPVKRCYWETSLSGPIHRCP